MSVAIGASAAGARSSCATAGRGAFVDVAEAACLRHVRPGIAHRDDHRESRDRRPINIWNDHSDGMSMRGCRLDSALCRNRPGSARSAHPGVSTGRRIVACPSWCAWTAQVPRACGRAGRHAHAGAGSCVSCLPTCRARCSIRQTGLDRREWWGQRSSWRSVTSSTPSRSRRWGSFPNSPRNSRKCSAAIRAGWCAPTTAQDAETIVVAVWVAVLGTIKDVVDEMREQGCPISALSRSGVVSSISRWSKCEKSCPKARRLLVECSKKSSCCRHRWDSWSMDVRTALTPGLAL